MHTRQESKIENFAFDYLRNFYSQRHAVKDIFVYMGAATKTGTLADGLFTYQKSKEEPAFIASLVTEHSAKLATILTAYKKQSFKKTSMAIAFLLTVAATFLIFELTANILACGVTLVVVWPSVYIMTMLLHKVYRERQIAGMLHTFKKLPANEKWLGISISSRTLRENVLAKSLQNMCKQKGIGIITVGRRAKVILVQQPENFTRRQGDFLSFYKDEFDIRKEMLGDNIMRVA